MTGKLFEPYMVTLDTLFGSNNYLIPVYQRPYSWGKEEVADLYYDIVEAYNGREPGTYEGVFAGTIYLKNDSKLYGKYDLCLVIDGQQRITTFTLLFLTVYCIAKKRGLDEDKEIVRVRDFLWRYVNKSYQKEGRLLHLGNIDRELLIKLFDVAYGTTNDLLTYTQSFTAYNSHAEKCLLDNIKYFWEEIEKNFSNTKKGNDGLLDFVDFILESTQFVVIYVNTSMNKVFEIFESINSKGKKLQEIDLIKSYIFQIIDENDHTEYLDKWGELITVTNDSLEDYLYVFIKAFVKYYKASLSVRYFKALCKNELVSFYQVQSIEEAVKMLIDDLLDKAKFYNMLFDETKLPAKFKTSSFLFYYNSIVYLGYQHPKPLLFKALCQYFERIISEELVKVIFKDSLSFMITFQTIYNRDSKDTIAVFERILTADYGVNQLRQKGIEKVFRNRLLVEGINQASLKEKLREYKGYAKQDKSEVIVLLAYYESVTRNKVAYDNANVIVSNRKMFQIDHILPRNPKDTDRRLKYYKKISENGDEILELKQGSDFPAAIQAGMDYKLFEEQILHKLGNLRITLSSKNQSKGNLTVNIGNYGTFTEYGNIENRSDELAEVLFDSELLSI